VSVNAICVEADLQLVMFSG